MVQTGGWEAIIERQLVIRAGAAKKDGDVEALCRMVSEEGMPQGAKDYATEALRHVAETSSSVHAVDGLIFLMGKNGIPEDIRIKAAETAVKRGGATKVLRVCAKDGICESVKWSAIEAAAAGADTRWVSEVVGKEGFSQKMQLSALELAGRMGLAVEVYESVKWNGVDPKVTAKAVEAIEAALPVAEQNWKLEGLGTNKIMEIYSFVKAYKAKKEVPEKGTLLERGSVMRGAPAREGVAVAKQKR